MVSDRVYSDVSMSTEYLCVCSRKRQRCVEHGSFGMHIALSHRQRTSNSDGFFLHCKKNIIMKFIILCVHATAKWMYAYTCKSLVCLNYETLSFAHNFNSNEYQLNAFECIFHTPHTYTHASHAHSRDRRRSEVKFFGPIWALHQVHFGYSQSELSAERWLESCLR